MIHSTCVGCVLAVISVVSVLLVALSSQNSIICHTQAIVKFAPAVAQSAGEWQLAAVRNFTEYQDAVLSMAVNQGLRKPFNHKSDWPLFKPIITCPPERPLARYPDVPGDGPKFLCSLKGHVLHDGCVIYSLGSNGEPEF
jgi:hypothetical protein